MSAPASPPPGWHPDPYGQAQLRYWDGTLWTGHVSGASAALAGRGSAGSRLRNGRMLVIFAGVFALLVVGGALAVSLTGHGGEVAIDCPKGRLCSNPPEGEPLVNGAVYRSSALGFEIEYSEDLWKVASQGEDFVEFNPVDAPGLMRVRIEGRPVAEASAQALFDEQLDTVQTNFVGLSEDTDPPDVVHGPAVGYVDGVGGAYTGGIDTPQGVLDGSAVVLAAGDEDVTLAVTLITTAQRAQAPGDLDAKGILYSRLDVLLNAIRYPSAAGAA